MRRLIYAILVLYATAIILPMTLKLAIRHAGELPLQAKAEVAAETTDYISLESAPDPGGEGFLIVINAHIREPVQTCSLVISYDASRAVILDADPAREGTQVQLGPSIAPSAVQDNRVDPSGTIYYALKGQPLLTGERPVVLGIIHLQLLTNAPGTIAFTTAYISDMQGGALLVRLIPLTDKPLVLSPPDVAQATTLPPAPTPTPTPLPPPPPTATPLLVVAPSPAPLPAPSPTPLVLAPTGDCGHPPMAWRDGIYIRLLQGQTLYGIARAFNTTVDALMQANGITDVSTIPAETLLFVPVPPPAGMGYSAYYVAPYDTLRSIADDFNLPVEALTCRNGDVLADGLQAGEWLRLRP